MGNQLRPHARNMLIGIQAKAVTASHTVFYAYTFLAVATAPSESFLDDRDEPVHHTVHSKSPGPSALDN